MTRQFIRRPLSARKPVSKATDWSGPALPDHICVDNGVEFFSGPLPAELLARGIEVRISRPPQPHIKGSVERAGRAKIARLEHWRPETPPADPNGEPE